MKRSTERILTTHPGRLPNPSNYAAVTSALGYRLRPWLLLRPELRGDFADAPAFGPSDSLRRSSAQLTAALECVMKF